MFKRAFEALNILQYNIINDTGTYFKNILALVILSYVIIFFCLKKKFCNHHNKNDKQMLRISIIITPFDNE